MVQPGGPAGHDGSPAGISGSNWAGYAATGNTGAFSSVSVSWTEPTAHCKSGDQYAILWAGLDGYSSETVEQTGSDVDCDGKTPVYDAWYEMYPANLVTFSNAVEPGDHLTTSVTYVGSNKFTVKFSDTTRGWSHTVTKVLAGAARSSAEVIVEAPPSGTGGVSLTDFGEVSFTGATVNGSGLCNSNPIASTFPGVTVSPITDCTNFTVTENQG